MRSFPRKRRLQKIYRCIIILLVHTRARSHSTVRSTPRVVHADSSLLWGTKALWAAVWLIVNRCKRQQQCQQMEEKQHEKIPTRLQIVPGTNRSSPPRTKKRTAGPRCRTCSCLSFFFSSECPLYPGICIIPGMLFSVILTYSIAYELHSWSFRTAVPFLGQNIQNLSSLSPKRDCGTKRANLDLSVKWFCFSRSVVLLYYTSTAFRLISFVICRQTTTAVLKGTPHAWFTAIVLDTAAPRVW